MKYRLGDICSITKGGIGIMKAVPGPYKMIALGEIDKTHNEYQFDTKAAIIPLVSSTGHGHASMKRVKYCEGKFALGNILCAVIPNDENFVLAKYLHIYLHWNREELLVAQMKGMANVSLPMNRIADVIVTVPSIGQQKEIINLEKRLVEKELEADKLFAEQLTQLENLNQAILQEAVQGSLVPAPSPSERAGGEAYEPASELLKRIKTEKATLQQAQGKGKKEKPLPPIKPEEIPFDIPENWVWCRLGEICEIKGGKRVSNGYKLLKTPTPHIYIRVTDMQKGTISDKDLHYLDENMYQKIKQYTISKNDLYMTIVGATIGKCGLVPEKFHDMNLTENAAKISPIIIDRRFLLQCLQSRFCQNQFLVKTKQVAVQKMALNRFSSSIIPLPPLSEQKRIVAEIERQLAKTKQLKGHIIANQQATEQLLKALLLQAFLSSQELGLAGEVKEMEAV